MPSQIREIDQDWLFTLHDRLGSWDKVSAHPGRFHGIPGGTISTIAKTRKIPRKWRKRFTPPRTPPVRVGECTDEEWAIIKGLTPEERKRRLLYPCNISCYYYTTLDE